MDWGGTLHRLGIPPLPILALVLAGCSGHHTEATTSTALEGCQVVDASACSSPIPSYASDVAPLIDRDCNLTCHAPGAGPWPLTSYEAVADWAEVISIDVAGCLMPPPDAGILKHNEQRTIVDWAACGAPQN